MRIPGGVTQYICSIVILPAIGPMARDYSVIAGLGYQMVIQNPLQKQDESCFFQKYIFRPWSIFTNVQITNFTPTMRTYF